MQSRVCSPLVIILIQLAFGFSLALDLRTSLLDAEKETDSVMKAIFEKWQVDKFPNFLKSCSMTKHSWDFMKLKYRERILDAFVSKKPKDFVICFAGSSVTAGHDSPFNKSFSVLTGEYMRSSLKALNVNVVIRSVALGNNPCYPYDICPRTFCGNDADIVHWEQSYFCGFNGDHVSTMEQFIRQSMFMTSHPIVIFADSATPNWYVLQTIASGLLLALFFECGGFLPQTVRFPQCHLNSIGRCYVQARE